MKAQKIYQGNHEWILFGRDPNKPEKIIDTNQYMIVSDGQALLLDPGGIELFSSMFANVLKHIKPEQLTALFASHQDPDIISSLGLWDQVIPHAKLYSPWLWEGFIRHFGMENIEYAPIKDEGESFKLGSLDLEFVPAHYLHSSGNMHLYDPTAKVLFSGDVGAALEEGDFPLFVEDFDHQIDKMRYFHQRWMPSNKAKQNWINRVRRLDIQLMCPQHGRIFKGEQVQEFLEWFEALEVGVAINT